MGLFDSYGNVAAFGGPMPSLGLFGGLLGAGYQGYGNCAQQAQEQQVRMARQQAPLQQHFTMPMGLGAYFGSSQQQTSCNPTDFGGERKIKHVESREVTCTEIAHKQISGAVQAVKDAQNE